MELVVRMSPDVMQPMSESAGPWSHENRLSMVLDETKSDDDRDAETEVQRAIQDDPEVPFQLSLLERMEIVEQIHQHVESHFGPDGLGVVGRGTSSPTFAPALPNPAPPSITNFRRGAFNRKLEASYGELLESDYLRIDHGSGDDDDRIYQASELWRISLRVGALNDVDYGEFVSELKRVVEPVLSAYRLRDTLLRKLAASREQGYVKSHVAVIGCSRPGTSQADSDTHSDDDAEGTTDTATDTIVDTLVSSSDQRQIFAATLSHIFKNAGISAHWVDTDEYANLTTAKRWDALMQWADGTVVVDDSFIDVPESLVDSTPVTVSGTDYAYQPDVSLDSAKATSATARDRGDPIQVVYTGVVPVVYKAQRTLLESLIRSIGWAFVMIALVMMCLLRNGEISPLNVINARAGLISMAPNIFPVVIIFGAMGHLGISVDIGTMMTASVAMGVAVDDTIHFLNWFRRGLLRGESRQDAIRGAYERVATAMTQTTLIGGLGLAVFAFSTFTPTQRFGVMMLALLIAALMGDLLLLPAILAGPLGKYFSPKIKADAAVQPTPAGKRPFFRSSRTASMHHRTSVRRTSDHRQKFAATHRISSSCDRVSSLGSVDRKRLANAST